MVPTEDIRRLTKLDEDRITCQPVLTATKPTCAQSLWELYSSEIPSSTDWPFHRFEPTFRHTTFEDIFRTSSLRLEARFRYGRGTRSFLHPCTAEAIQTGARRRGSMVGLAASEAFDLVRATPFGGEAG